jgi:hypothetical protein
MSQDQRPGRVRVFSSGSPAETARRRRTDPKSVMETPSVDAEPTTAGWSLRTTLVGGLIFLIAAALGGMVAVRFGLAGMPVR